MNDAHNPYRPPQANVDSSDARPDLEPVGRGRRFATYLIDYVIMNAMLFAAGFLAVVIFGEAGARAVGAVNEFVLAIVATIVYYVFFEGMWARTPAKFILGTIVVREEDGGQPTLGTVVKRTLCRFIPFEPLSFFGERGWHDSISRTRVVSTRGG